MKYDLNKKKTKFAERVLYDFSDILFDLLQEKPLESITVNELCKRANYPRATFYNYFDDIYDLLNYCWQRMTSDIVISDYAWMQQEARTFILFDRCYTYLSGYQKVIDKIMQHNPMEGRFVESLRGYLREQIFMITVSSPVAENLRIPREMIAEHYANTIQMALEWCFIREEHIAKETAIDTLHYLLGAL